MYQKCFLKFLYQILKDNIFNFSFLKYNDMLKNNDIILKTVF